jgi:hypothetical protein
MHRLQRTRCAVATNDDTVGVYDVEKGDWEGIVLCHEFQHSVACKCYIFPCMYVNKIYSWHTRALAGGDEAGR